MPRDGEQPCVLSQVPGRLRVHLPGWTTGEACQIEAWLYRVEGVKSVQANPLTGNVLIHFDRGPTDEQRLLAELQEVWAGLLEAPSVNPPARDGIREPVRGRSVSSSLLRVGVRGLLGHAVVDSLWFGAGFLGSALGLPLAGLGPLHVLMDIAVCGMALGAGIPRYRSPTTGNGPPTAFHQGHHRQAPWTPGRKTSGGHRSEC